VEEALAADIVKVKNAGFNPLLTSGPKRPATMHRLIYAEYDSRDQAEDTVQQLSNQGVGSFLAGTGSGLEVVLGSYMLLSGAQEDQKRLAEAGITVVVKKALVQLPTRKLTVGTYTDQKTASNVLNKLKAAGISTSVME
jgi:cell division protein FtsN